MALTATGPDTRVGIDHHAKHHHPNSIKQRQLGLLRNSYSRDILRRSSARRDQCETSVNCDSAFSELDKAGKEMMSDLAVEKLRMLQQIRKDNATTLRNLCKQKSSRSNSAPVRNKNTETPAFVYSKSKKLVSTDDVLSGNIPVAQKNSNVDVAKSLSNRSKYLPVLMNEFKRLQMNFGLGILPNLTSQSATDHDCQKSWENATCTAILAALKASREEKMNKRAPSAPKNTKGHINMNGKWGTQKPRSCIPTFREFVKRSASSGPNLGSGVASVYNHIPAPPPKDYRVHWNRRPSSDSVLITALDKEQRKTDNRPNSVGKHVRTKTVPPWTKRRGVLNSGNTPEPLGNETKEEKQLLLCSRIHLARSRLVGRDALPRIDKSKIDMSKTLKYTKCKANHEIDFKTGSEELGKMSSIPDRGLQSSDKARRSVRFSEEEDKVFEYRCDDPVGQDRVLTEDNIARCKNTLELRGILDFSAKKS